MKYLSIPVLLLSQTLLFGQLSVNNSLYTTSQLVSTVFAPAGNGVNISNVTFKGVYNVSSRYQVGYFSTAGSVTTNLEMSSGILLTSGNTTEIPMSDLTTHPGAAAQVSRNYVSGTTGEVRSSNAASGQDADVAALCSPYNYYNATILEFDFVPANANVSFRYTFGSEEYMDNGGFINYNCSSYNDHFGFLLSGPGIAGGAGYSNNAINIAQLSNGSSVAINAVNNGVVGSSGGAPSAAKCQSANSAWVQNTPTGEFKGPIYGINFNGNTKVLTASRSGLTPGSTYHIRLIVSDVSDGAYDSGVFLEAGSFNSPTTLPVTYKEFNVTCLQEGTLINWITMNETDNMLFEVERSYDGIQYETVSKIIGAGNSSNYKAYRVTDFTMEEECYYRIKQTDRNGEFSFSNVIHLSRMCKNTLYTFNLFPNPAQNNVNIDLSGIDEQLRELKVFNSMGECVINTAPLNTSIDGKDYLNLDITQLQAGVYLVNLRGSLKEYQSKLVIARQ